MRGQDGGDISRQAKRLCGFADRGFRAVMDHRGGDGGAVAAVTGIEILDHLLAPLMLEIDIDIRRLAAFGGNETLE